MGLRDPTSPPRGRRAATSGEVLAGVRRRALDHPLRRPGGERDHFVLETVVRLLRDDADESRVGEAESPVDTLVGVHPDPAFRVRTAAITEGDRGGRAPRRREVVCAVGVVVRQEEQGDRDVVGQRPAARAAEGLERRSGDAGRRPQAPIRPTVRQDRVEWFARWIHDRSDHGPLLVPELVAGGEHGAQDGTSVDRRGRSRLDPGQGGVAGGEQAQRGVEVECSVGGHGAVERAQVAGVHRQRGRRRGAGDRGGGGGGAGRRRDVGRRGQGGSGFGGTGCREGRAASSVVVRARREGDERDRAESSRSIPHGLSRVPPGQAGTAVTTTLLR